ncbi:hypothetical protein DXC99_05070 [Collinsella sp. TF10-11AT]|nr:hypothetical protein DXC99_05070 [Collinsella sp. TF10-11AT]
MAVFVRTIAAKRVQLRFALSSWTDKLIFKKQMIKTNRVLGMFKTQVTSSFTGIMPAPKVDNH